MSSTRLEGNLWLLRPASSPLGKASSEPLPSPRPRPCPMMVKRLQERSWGSRGDSSPELVLGCAIRLGPDLLQASVYTLVEAILARLYDRGGWRRAVHLVSPKSLPLVSASPWISSRRHPVHNRNWLTSRGEFGRAQPDGWETWPALCTIVKRTTVLLDQKQTLLIARGKLRCKRSRHCHRSTLDVALACFSTGTTLTPDRVSSRVLHLSHRSPH